MKHFTYLLGARYLFNKVDQIDNLVKAIKDPFDSTSSISQVLNIEECKNLIHSIHLLGNIFKLSIS